MITYEQPLNEKIRLFLRLELLVRRFNYHTSQPDQSDTLAALHVVLELYNLAARIDLKGDVIKEIDRISQSARRSIETEVEQQNTLDVLQEHLDRLYKIRGSLGQHLHANMLFSQLRQRTTLPGGLNGFDIPLLNHWLGQEASTRTADLLSWGEPFVITANAVGYILELIRTYCEGTNEVAKAGFYQASLHANKTYQMLQIELNEPRNVYPEISAGKQRFSLRFVELDLLSERGKQWQDNVDFRLKLCAF